MKNTATAAFPRAAKLAAIGLVVGLSACSTESEEFDGEDSAAEVDQTELDDFEDFDVQLFVAEREAEQTEPGLMETASFAADASISMDEAAERLDWQERSGWLLDIAPQQLGDAYGGMWIDVNDGNRVKVAIVASPTGPTDFAAGPSARGVEAMKSRAATLIEDFGIEDGADVVEVRHSLAELEDANRWLTAKMVELGSPRLSGGLRTDLNAVELRILEGEPLNEAETALLDEASERYGDLLELGAFDEQPSTDACTGDFCDTPLRGGVHIYTTGHSGCTGAFIAKSRVDNKFYQFTAGHCVDDGFDGTWTTRFSDNSTHHIGAVHNSVFGGSQGDVAIIRINNVSGWFGGAKNRVFVRARAGETTRNEAYRINATTTSKIGDRVCMSGRTTGTDCGTVQALGQTVTYSNGTTVQNLGRASYCRAGGDSGGPVYASGKAFGIHSGGGGSCTAYYTGIRGAENSMNVDVVTN